MARLEILFGTSRPQSGTATEEEYYAIPVVTLRLEPSTREGLAAVAEVDRRPLATFLVILEDWYEAKREAPKQ